MLGEVKMLFYIHIQLIALLTFNFAATISETFRNVDGMALNNTWTAIPSYSQYHCAYMCVIIDPCLSVNYNTITQECQLSVVPSPLLDLYAQPNSSFNIFFKGIVN